MTTNLTETTDFSDASQGTLDATLVTEDPKLTEETFTQLPMCDGLGIGVNYVENGYCAESTFNTGGCCVHLGWIAGLAAGISGVITIVLISVIIWLATKNKEQKDDKEMLVSEMDKSQAGFDQLTSQDNDAKQPERKTASDSKGRQTELKDEERIEQLEASASPKEMKPDDEKLRLGSSKFHHDSQLYDDIQPYNKEQAVNEREDGGSIQYYNVASDLRPRADSVHKHDLTGKDRRDEHRPDKEGERKNAAKLDGIDLEQFADFVASLDHVDPKEDYSIKRPVFTPL